MIFINLSNGIEALAHFESGVKADGFIRIQSSHLEGGHFSRVIEGLDYNFMVAALMGRPIVVVDAASRNPFTLSRAQWMGIPWICYFLDQHVKRLKPSDTAVLKRYPLLKPPFQDVTDQFKQVVLSDAARTKARYLRKFVSAYPPDPVCIKPFVSMRSQLDGKYDKLARELKERYATTIRG